jgi:hypothetical protein
MTYSILFTPTLIDADGARHIIPGKDMPAYCGATGTQSPPAEHRKQHLCQRCVQKYLRAVFDIRAEEFGL